MLSNPRMSFRFASGNDRHSAPSGILFTTVIWGRFPRPHRLRRPACRRIACPQPLSPLHQPEQALPADNRCAHTRLSNDALHHGKPTEGAWSNMKNGLGNLAACTLDQLAANIRNRLRRIQYRPGLIDGFLAQTGLALEPPTAETPSFQPL